jgi:SPP1 gp7 family putative phage head morphogenesis protein
VLETDKIVDSLFVLLMKAEADEREDEAMAFRAVMTQYEKRLRLILKDFFKKMGKEVLGNLDYLKNISDFVMFDQEVWRTNFVRALRENIKRSYHKNGKRVFNDLSKMGKQYKFVGVGITYDVEYEEALQYIDERPLIVADEIISRWEFDVDEILSEGFRDGLTIVMIADNLSDHFDHVSDYYSEMVARTEMSRAANMGALAAYKQSGVVEYKEWLTAQDEKVCPYCGQIDRMQTRLNENFLDLGASLLGTDGKTMTNNYLPVATPPLHPHCRCTLLPVTKTIRIEPELNPIDSGVLYARELLLPKTKKSGVEYALFFDSSGKQLAVLRGGKAHVTIPKKYHEDLKGGELYHTHPNGSSFSGADIGVLADFKLKKMVAVADNASYEVSLKQGGEFVKPIVYKEDLNFHVNELFGEYKPQLDDLIASGMPYDDAVKIVWREHSHAAVKRLSDKWDLDYKRTKENG